MPSLVTNALALLLELAAGYGAASLVESYLHQHVGHAPGRVVRRWQRHPWLMRASIHARHSHHVVHHRRTFRQDHVTQFRSDGERGRLDAELAGHGAQGEAIRRSGYGLSLQGDGALVFALPLLPALPLAGSAPGRWALAGAAVALALPPLLSHCIHPYLHMPHERALRAAPKATAWLLRRRYFRAMARSHYLYHRHVAVSSNLLLGGDLLRGCHRAPGEKDLMDMRRLGLPVD